MKYDRFILRYGDEAGAAPALILCGPRRIELFILANEDTSFSLVLLSGKNGSAADREKLQGPYELRDQAVAARSAIIQSLQAREFKLAANEIPQWQLLAQSIIRNLRHERLNYVVDCSFDPDDVYPP